MEWSRTHGQRGLVASWPQFGVPCGLLLSTLAVTALSSWSGDQFLVWGWRIPFALSIILVGVGLWIRLGILETPVFQKLLDEDKTEKAPILEVIKKQPREIILSALLRMSEQAPFYVFTAFVFAYTVGTLHMSRNFILSAVMVAACVSFITIPLSGHISDRIGRRKMYLIGVVIMGLFGFLYFGMVDTAIPSAVFIAIVLSLIPHDIQYGPQAALIAEIVHAAAPLQRRFARLSASVDHCRRAGADHRDRLVRDLSYRLRGRHLHRRLRGDQPGIGGFHARLHRPGYLG